MDFFNGLLGVRYERERRGYKADRAPNIVEPAMADGGAVRCLVSGDLEANPVARGETVELHGEIGVDMAYA